MKRIAWFTAVSGALLLVLVGLAACGGGGDSARLRAQVATLQTQVARPTQTSIATVTAPATAKPTSTTEPPATPTPPSPTLPAPTATLGVGRASSPINPTPEQALATPAPTAVATVAPTPTPDGSTAREQSYFNAVDPLLTDIQNQLQAFEDYYEAAALAALGNKVVLGGAPAPPSPAPCTPTYCTESKGDGFDTGELVRDAGQIKALPVPSQRWAGGVQTMSQAMDEYLQAAQIGPEHHDAFWSVATAAENLVVAALNQMK